MTGFLSRLLLLSLIFTVCGGAALLFRQTPAGKSGKTMSRIWAAVLILAILPLRLPAGWVPEVPTPAHTAILPMPESVPADAVPDHGPLQPVLPSDEAAPPVWSAQEKKSAFPLPTMLLLIWLCGGAITLILPLRRNRRLCGMLRTCSSPCTDEKALAQLAALAQQAGLRRSPQLRILDSGVPFPPCTAGIVRPCIFLLAELPPTEAQRAVIFAHELCHIRRGDIWRKLFALAVTAVHWFNPLAHVILPRVYEDLEPACDRDALHLLGGDSGAITYMQTLVEVASTLHACRKNVLILGLTTTKQQIERRFLAMKKSNRRTLHTALALLLVCAMALGASVIFTACVPASASPSPLEALTPLTERIVRFYYDLAPEDAITAEMLEGITALRLSADPLHGTIGDTLSRLPEQSISPAHTALIEQLAALLTEKTLVSFHVNYTETAPDSFAANAATLPLYRLIPRRFFEESMLTTITNSFDQRKFAAHYCLKDATDEAVTSREREQLLNLFPWVGSCPTYICDPTMSEFELPIVYSYLLAAGFFDPQLDDDGIIDTAALYAAFPNLTTLELVGLTEAQ